MGHPLLEETNVSNNEKFSDLLDDLQANILKHHGRKYAYHVFLKFKDSDLSRKWISKVEPNITTAKQQLEKTKRFKEERVDGGTIFTLSLSRFGYEFLNTQDNMPDDIAFNQSLKNRAQILEDDISLWEDEFKNDIDCLLIIADNKEEVVLEKIKSIKQDIIGVAEIIKLQKGKVLKRGNIGIEHFGYADGISQPLYLKEQINQQGQRNQWNDKATLDKVLVKDKGGQHEYSFGSLLVFRKLEQNVKAFKLQEQTIAIKDINGQLNPELGGAMVTGRFRDGTETVSKSVKNGHTHEHQINNDFDYRDDLGGAKCPFHSHIRLTNPRADVGDFAHKVRITRRGIPYNDIEHDENNLPEHGVGLLFMCYQSNIINQFEFIQNSWANEGEIGIKLVGQDGIIGQGDNTFKKKIPKQWGDNTKLNPCDFSNPKSKFVTMKGGEYFFTPSISFLKSLNTVLLPA